MCVCTRKNCKTGVQKMKKMWSVLVHMSHNMWGSYKEAWNLDDETWDKILQMASEKGYNTIVLDVGDGIMYESHPEISLEGAWSHARVKKEIKKAADLGLKIIPKLNFSASHDAWLGEYERMVSTKIYYGVCRDLIREVYEVFEHPEYIHLGMDEENSRLERRLDFVCYRKGQLIWEDLKYLCGCVSQTGAKPWIWADFLIHHPEEFKKHFKGDDVLVSPWQYFAMYEEHFTPIKDNPRDEEYYTSGIFAGSGIVYVEEDPVCADYRREIIPAMEEGFCVVPCVSYFNKNKYNHCDTLRYFKEKAPDSGVIGFMAAPWKMTTPDNLNNFEEDMNLLMDVKKIYYPEN